MGFVGLSGEDAVRAKTGEGWEYLAQRLDGVFLNLVGSDLDSRRGIYSRIVSKRAVLPHHLINGLDAPSVKASLREMARYNFTMAGAVLTSWGDSTRGLKTSTWAAYPPKTLIPVKAAFAKKVPPIKKFFINVKTSVALWYSIRQPDKAVIAASDGAVVELAACRAFHRGRQNDTLGEMDYQLQRFVPAMRKLAKEKRKNLKAIWQMVIHKTCPQLGTTNPIPMDIKKAYFYLKERNALPDTFYVLNYVDDVDIFPENDGKGGYPNTMAGGVRWLLDQIDRDWPDNTAVNSTTAT